MQTEEIYAAIGPAVIGEIVSSFYSQVPADDVLGSMYPQGDIPGAEQRLRDFLLFRFGGPRDYLASRGHPRLRMRHAPFRIDNRARDRWLELMSRAMDETKVPPDARSAILAFFGTTADFLVNTRS